MRGCHSQGLPQGGCRRVRGSHGGEPWSTSPRGAESSKAHIHPPIWGREPQGRVGVRRWLPWPCLRLLSGDRGLPTWLRRTQAYLGPHDAQNSLHHVKKLAGAGQGLGVGRRSGDSPGRSFFEEGPCQSPRSRVLLPWQVGLREGSSPHGQLMENARSACVFLCAAVKSCWWEGTPDADPTTPPQGHRTEADKWDP